MTPSAPAAPDPKETAAAQSQMNKETAITQYGLNATNQYTPQGSIEYTQQGTWADGTPRFFATQSYSPTEQGIYESGAKTRQNLSDIGATQSAKIGDLLNTPYNLNEATQAKIAGLQTSFLDPQWARNEEKLRTQLINSGLRPGTAAYQQQMADFSDNRQSAYNRAYLDSYKTAEASSLAERNQPINEITALMSGSQVSNPSYANTPTPGVAPTDYLGAVQQSLNQENLGYQAKVNQQQGLMSGLFGLGSAALGGWGMSGFKTSDARLKRDISRIGRADDGTPIYKYRMAGSDVYEIGFMAQDLLETKPWAVAVMPSGYLAVDYNVATGGSH